MEPQSNTLSGKFFRMAKKVFILNQSRFYRFFSPKHSDFKKEDLHFKSVSNFLQGGEHGKIPPKYATVYKMFLASRINSVPLFINFCIS